MGPMVPGPGLQGVSDTSVCGGCLPNRACKLGVCRDGQERRVPRQGPHGLEKPTACGPGGRKLQTDWQKPGTTCSRAQVRVLPTHFRLLLLPSVCVREVGTQQRKEAGQAVCLRNRPLNHGGQHGV